MASEPNKLISSVLMENHVEKEVEKVYNGNCSNRSHQFRQKSIDIVSLLSNLSKFIIAFFINKKLSKIQLLLYLKNKLQEQ